VEEKVGHWNVTRARDNRACQVLPTAGSTHRRPRPRDPALPQPRRNHCFYTEPGPTNLNKLTTQRLTAIVSSAYKTSATKSPRGQHRHSMTHQGQHHVWLLTQQYTPIPCAREAGAGEIRPVSSREQGRDSTKESLAWVYAYRSMHLLASGTDVDARFVTIAVA
jgi:hypothetical protein